MASDISAGVGTFTVANIKPAPDDEITALTHQNMADNVGFLFGRPIGWINGFGTEGSYHSAIGDTEMEINYKTYFRRIPGHNKFVGTYQTWGTFEDYIGPGGPDCYFTDGFVLSGDLGNLTLNYTATNSDIGSRWNWGSTRAFTADLSSIVSEGRMGTFNMRFYGTSHDKGGNDCFVQYQIGTPSECYTKWG